MGLMAHRLTWFALFVGGAEVVSPLEPALSVLFVGGAEVVLKYIFLKYFEVDLA
jgi:hypothetical protein